ncbi:hypothetical protein ACA351_09195 [Orientia tsutsugamushi]|uniref:hypothetical protein n=1 Tax=Orientia tsutsugamushi TaxID=784 RepID=UPI003528AA4E
MKCCYSELLINKLLILNEKVKDKIDMGIVKKAIYFAKKYHGDQKLILININFTAMI